MKQARIYMGDRLAGVLVEDESGYTPEKLFVVQYY